MHRGPHPTPLSVSDADHAMLVRWTRRRTTAQALALRARIVLACGDHPEASPGELAARLGVHRATIHKWHARLAQRGLDGLLDEPRPGAPRTIGDAAVERVLTLTLEEPPPTATHWSTRTMARRVGLSQTAISRIWRAFALAPHRVETFKLSTAPLFIAKVRDIVGLYLHPPARALVLCVDEKTQISAHEPTAPVLPLRPGQVERHTHDDLRHGTTDLFAALDLAAGTVIGETHRRHRSVEFRHFLDTVDRNTPPTLDVHLILDNASIHKTPLIHRWLAKRPRFHVHFTPTSASWLNLVESWLALLTRRQLTRGVYRSTAALERAIRAYIARANTDAKPFVWTKTADEIFESVARFGPLCQRTSNSDH